MPKKRRKRVCSLPGHDNQGSIVRKARTGGNSDRGIQPRQDRLIEAHTCPVDQFPRTGKNRLGGPPGVLGWCERPRHDHVETPRRERLHPAEEYVRVRQRKFVDHCLKEGRPAPPSFHQNERSPRHRDRQGNPGQPGPAPEIHDRGTVLDLDGGSERVPDMALPELVPVCCRHRSSRQSQGCQKLSVSVQCVPSLIWEGYPESLGILNPSQMFHVKHPTGACDARIEKAEGSAIRVARPRSGSAPRHGTRSSRRRSQPRCRGRSSARARPSPPETARSPFPVSARRLPAPCP
jgi:hypothetical protein